MFADRGCKDRIAAVDGILNVTQDMGEADLMRYRQIRLAGIAVRHPDVGPVTSQDFLGDTACPA
jgi:hypothetical protein